MHSTLRRIPATSLYTSRPTHWLVSRFHFSFSEYFDPTNQRFGVLRVLNDDIVTPGDGFGRHPHQNMEIVSYVVRGKLSHAHRDVFGKTAKETLGRGAIQYMSAGRGVQHEEMNDETEPVRFLQLWIVPDARGHIPNYGSKTFTRDDRLDKLLRVVSGQVGVEELSPTTDGSVAVHQDANVYVSEASAPGVVVPVPVPYGRQAYLVCIEGELEARVPGREDVAAVRLSERDALEVRGPADALEIEAKTEGAHFLVVEMARDDSVAPRALRERQDEEVEFD